MKPKSEIQLIFSIALLLLLIVTISGCGQTNTPASGLTVIYLRNGSEAVLNGAAEIGLSKLVGLETTLLDSHTWISKGEMLVISQLPAGIWFTVVNPMGFIAHVTADKTTPGAIMLVNYNPVTRVFTIDCIQGICELGPTDSSLSTVPLNNQGSLDQNGNFQKPKTFDANQINTVYGNYIQQGGPIPTFTSGPANIVQATNVPATATPTNPGPNQAGTATAVCKTFTTKFPGTPCP